MAQVNITLSQEEILELLQTDRSDAFKVLLQNSLNAIIEAESDEKLKAKPYERTEERTDSRNGIRERPLNTRLGSIVLNVPRHREQPFHTLIFDNYQRSESALISTMAEMVVAGVSTRKVSKVMETICDTSFSKSSVSKACERLDSEVEKFRKRKLEYSYPFVIVDATYFKVREDRKVVSKALMIAIGISERGHREVIGVSAYKNESKETWSMFFEELKYRGLKGVRTITSDAHEGIFYAMMEHFPEVPWQRCQYHFSKNIVEKAPKMYREGLRLELKSMFTAIDLESATKKMNQIATDYRDVAEKSVECLEKGFIDAMTNLELPEEIRKCVRTSNYLERLNKELKRRSNVIGIFPNTRSLIRLMTSVLIEQHDKWSTQRRCFFNPGYLKIEKSVIELEKLAKKQHEHFKAA